AQHAARLRSGETHGEVHRVVDGAEGEAEGTTGTRTDGGGQVHGEVRDRHPLREGAEALGGGVGVVATTRGSDGAREDEAGRVRRGGGHVGVAAPLDTHVLEVAARRLDDARLDEHLRRLGVEGAHQLLDLIEGSGYVPGDQSVRAVVDGDRAAVGQQHRRTL